MAGYVSPFATALPELPPVAGVRLATAHSGMRYKGRDDLLLAELAEGTSVAGVLTRNTMCGCPVDWCRKILPRGRARALAVNAGIANVFTGVAGVQVISETVAATAKLLSCAPEDVYVGSTGIIGELIPVDKITAKLPEMKAALRPDAWEKAARAIMTTDTFPKGITRTARIGDAEVRINGFIKGSGMIAPNMATMLGYVFTDAAIPASVLQSMLSEDVTRTYNCITVDSDTSTSDTILCFATGQAKHPAVKGADDPALRDFRQAFRQIHEELAKLVVKDGEGISKFITIHVRGAASDESARKIGLSIANSPLFKTAVTGGDPNWGRIVAAVGKSGEASSRDRTSLWIGGTLVAENGAKHPAYVEADALAHLKGSAAEFAVDVGAGTGQATVWTTDLTAEYIRINVDYRS